MTAAVVRTLYRSFLRTCKDVDRLPSPLRISDVPTHLTIGKGGPITYSPTKVYSRVVPTLKHVPLETTVRGQELVRVVRSTFRANARPPGGGAEPEGSSAGEKTDTDAVEEAFECASRVPSRSRPALTEMERVRRAARCGLSRSRWPVSQPPKVRRPQRRAEGTRPHPFLPLSTPWRSLPVATTCGIELEVATFHLPDSVRGPGPFAFPYRIRLVNKGRRTLRVAGRQWDFKAMNDTHVSVPRHTPGVVGEYPVLKPGSAFEYMSFVELSTAEGSMEGSLQCLDLDTEEEVDLVAPPTRLGVEFALPMGYDAQAA